MIRPKKKDVAQEVDDALYALSKRLDSLEGGNDADLSDGTAVLEANASPALAKSNSSWDQCVEEARANFGSGHSIDELLSETEIKAADEKVRRLNEEFASVHRLDAADIAISVSAGVLSAVVSIVLVGIPERTHEGLRGKPLENYVRDWFSKTFPQEEMEKLANDISSKVPYDAPYNTNFTEKYVEGLWPTMHRLYSLGHDPLLGFVVGTLDILTGRMTTIDKLGEFAVQEIPRYADRKAANLFAALCKQVIHLKSQMPLRQWGFRLHSWVRSTLCNLEALARRINRLQRSCRACTTKDMTSSASARSRYQ
ncbi:hypothetical protein [Rubneribacter badeniensis]|uniref:hypothetical protein n=1 Tax=Rubneribacter badeniensis TaxID=2070688 RepID=UPI003A9123DB